MKEMFVLDSNKEYKLTLKGKFYSETCFIIIIIIIIYSYSILNYFIQFNQILLYSS